MKCNIKKLNRQEKIAKYMSYDTSRGAQSEFNSERVAMLMAEVKRLGLNPQDYEYGYGALNAWRRVTTKYGDYIKILIPLVDGYREATVDFIDFLGYRMYTYRWCASHSDPKKAYPHTNIYNERNVYVNLMMHELIMGKVAGKVIDHNDGDHFNNSRSNLNHVTTAQNNCNRHNSKSKSQKTKYAVIDTYATAQLFSLV